MIKEFILSRSLLELILLGILLGTLLIQQIYWWLSYKKLLFYKTPESKTVPGRPLPPVSIIICAKNESDNLKKFLPLVLQQDYPDFQVVVVNDCSEDDSEEVLEELQQKYPQLYFTNVKSDPIYRHGKKLAVTLGIKAAKHEHLVFTDADCFPNSEVWLRSMAMHFTDKKQLLLGTSPYEQGKGLLHQVIAYETLQTAIAYISSAMRGAAYMGVGRNMAYTKTLFYEHKGFSGHTHLLSGDDDLFVNKAANAENVDVEISSEAQMISIPETHWNEYFKQKRRHMTTGPLYKKRHKRRFVFESMLGFVFYASCIAMMFFPTIVLIAIALFLIRFLLKSLIYYIAAQKLSFKKAYFFQNLWLDIIVPVFRFIALTINMVKPQKFTWR